MLAMSELEMSGTVGGGFWHILGEIVGFVSVIVVAIVIIEIVIL